MKINLSKPSHQYLIGLLVNFAFLALLYSFDTSYKNLQIPVGQYQNNIWRVSDVMDYVGPGMNFSHYGVFGVKYQPDHLRPIGYPAIISFTYSLFGKNWLLALQILQCVLFAFLYPINTLIAKELLPSISDKVLSYIFIFLLVSGTYFIRPMMILSDTFFTLFFNLGFLFGLRAYKINNNYFLFAYILCFTIACLVRPMMILFPIINLSILFFIARQNGIKIISFWRKLVITTLILVFTCNLSSIRNYSNYGFLSPGSCTWGIYLKQMTCKVLAGVNKTDQYQAYLKEAEGIKNIAQKTEFSEHIMISTIKKYPYMTLKVLLSNAICVCLDNHLTNNFANYFDYNWKIYSNSGITYDFSNPYSQNSPYPFKRSMLSYFATYFMMLVYSAIWLLFISLFINFLKTGKYEYTVIISTLIFILLLPGIFNGNAGSRYRLTIESFLVILSFYQFTKITVMETLRLYQEKLSASWWRWALSGSPTFSQLTIKGKVVR